MLISVKQLLSKYVFYDKMIPQYQLFSKTIFLLKRETPFCSTIPDFFIIVAVSHRNTIVINIEIKVQ